MGIKFTPQQQQVIDSRNRNLLVSAAAGSGKTAVLVERIIQRIMDPKNPVDIDRLVVVTFTEAAAAEMRERIGAAIEERIQQEPQNLHLQRQSTLIHHALITTIHSFCLFVIRNNFNDIGLDPGFRVADPGELALMKQEVLQELIERRLGEETSRAEFRRLMDHLAHGGGAKGLEALILESYEFAQSFPWPKTWLAQRKEDYLLPEGGTYATYWGGILRKEQLQEEWKKLEEKIEELLPLCLQEGWPKAYLPALESDLELVHLLAKKEPWEQEILLEELKFATLSRKKQEGVEEEAKEFIKKKRNRIKEEIKKVKETYFPFSEAILTQRMGEMGEIVGSLVDAVLDFGEGFSEKKREKNVIDFSDMEHFALDILVEQREVEGELTWEPSKTAREYQDYFQEIMIDEYQDSNPVQEYLLRSISGEWEGRYNRFMVGDLKQSIYRFRMARPEIFLEKYETYTREESDCQCIALHQNFRSRREVLDSVNGVFEQLMGKELGRIEYTQEEALHEGAVYPQPKQEKDYQTELLLLEQPEREAKKAEARMVAGRILGLMEKQWVTDKETGELRRLKYKDIAILFRSGKDWDEVFFQELSRLGIPVILTSRTGYFQTKEVQNLLNFLRVIDNPRQDIPLYGVLCSLLGGFTKEEVARVRKRNRGCLYDDLLMAIEEAGLSRPKEDPFKELEKPKEPKQESQYSVKEQAGEEKPHKEEQRRLGEKCLRFLERIDGYRKKVTLTPVHQILQEYLQETGYLYTFLALPGGEQKAANIHMLMKKAEVYEKTGSFGLFRFIRYLEQLQKYEVDEGEAGITDEGQDAVKMMTIHKSKGLEFPVCFVSGLSKRFNQQDSKKNCIMDMDLGLGLDYRKPEKGFYSTDLRKKMILRKQEWEALGEEMRVLYVAMTRAKEKLILTGVVKGIEQTLLDLERLKKRKERKLPLYLLAEAKSYLDWLLGAAVRRESVIQIIPWAEKKQGEEQKAKTISQEWLRIELENRLADFCPGQEVEELKAALSFVYGHENLQGLYAKTTVSELKKGKNPLVLEEQEEEHSLFVQPEIVPYIPAFMEGVKEVAATTRGTAYHRVLELMDYTKMEDWQSWEEQMQSLTQKGRLAGGDLALISRKKMEQYLASSLFRRMKEAALQGKLYREKPFVLGLTADCLDARFPKEEKVLIQGIMDAWFVEDGELVLVDYKTDRIREPHELIRRYREQLDYYQMALERLTGKRVKEKLLYSFGLGMVVPCP